MLRRIVWTIEVMRWLRAYIAAYLAKRPLPAPPWGGLKRADILLVRKGPFGDSVEPDACAHVLLQTTARDIDTVIVDGHICMANGTLRKYDAARAKTMIANSRQQLLA
jgi:hypothetical protein